MITVNKANPTPGEITSSLTGSTGDGAGLHFENQGNISLANSAAVEFGTSDFSVEFVLNQTGDNANDNYIFYTHEAGNSRLYVYNDISADTLDLAFVNSSGSTFTKSLAYDMSADYGTPTHYVVTFDRDGNATLYKNGNSVATVDISDQASVDIGASNTNSGLIATAANGYGVLGTFYRFRTWNKLVDAKALYERADVPVADQYGSQTSKILNGTSWTGASGTTPPTSWTVGTAGTFTIDSSSGSGSEPALKITRNADNPYIYQTFSAVVGKQYRVKYRAKNVDATHVRVGIGSSAIGTQYNATDTTATSWQDFEQTYTATTTTFSVYVQVATTTGSQSGYIDSLVVEQVGCVSDYDLAFANPTQSRTVQDRAGAADGTASSSGVSQVQPVVQGNLTSLAVTTSQQAAGVPADGVIIADKLGVGIAPSHAATIYGTGAGNATLQIEGEGGADPTINFLTNNATHWAVGVDDSDSDKFKIVQHSAIGSTNNFFTIDSSGRLGVGKSPDTTFEVAASSAHARITGNSGTSPELQLSSAGAVNWKLRSNVSSSDFRITKDSTDCLTIDSTGQSIFTRDDGLPITSNRTTSDGDAIHVRKDNYTRLRLGTLGITFPNGAGAAPTAAAANQLDYYEEGTFTPTVSGSTTAGSYTIGSTVANYTRIGNVVTVNVSLINITESSAGSGNLVVGGMPFASATSNTQAFCGSTRIRSYTDAGASPVAYLQGNDTTIVFGQYVSGTSDDIMGISGISSGNSDISFSLTYFV